MGVNQSALVRELCIPSDRAEGLWVQDQIVEQLESRQFSNHDVFGVRLALEEALSNAIRHGNKMDTDKTVRIRYSIDATRVIITIEDEGAGFDLANVPDPTLPENLEQPSGRGILLMRSFMTSVTYNDTGNQVTLEKRRTVHAPEKTSSVALDD